MPDIFLSYNREDQAAARRFAEAFEKEGFSVWWDATLRSGEAYDQVTEKALREARAVVVLWSKRSAESRWVRAEATLADRNGTLVPAMIEPCERPIMFELTQTADLTHWQGAPQDRAWLAFVADVRRFVETLSEPRPSAPVQAAKRTAAGVGKPAILVLPFINMSADPEQEFFSDGVSEDIITDLGHVAALSVVSRTTAFGYKGRTVAVAELAQALGVSHIVEGSVRKAGQRVRITAQLLDAASDTPLWSERFDRTLEDIFAIQSEIAEAIVAALKVKLAPAEKRAIENRATSSPEAYSLYLMARQFSRMNTERLQPIVLRLSQRAVELDSDFAAAWALISSAQCEMHQRGVSVDDGRAAADRAVALRPDLAEAHAARADVLTRGGEYAAGLAAALEALKLDPDCFESHMSAGFAYTIARDHARAVQHFEQASAFEPNACRPVAMAVSQYEALGNPENARAAGRRAIALAERILAIEPDHGVALSAKVAGLTVLRDVERAREWSRLAQLLCPDNVRLHYNCACGLAILGDVDEVVAIMDGLIAEASLGYLRWMQTDSDFDAIRGDPRIVALMQRVSDRIAAG